MMNRMERAAALAMACFVMATGCGDGSPQPDAMDVVNQELVEADTRETDTAESDVHQDDVEDPDVNVKEGAIGIDGGQLAVPSGPTLTVPAQALEDEVVISISRMTWTDPGAPENTEGDSLVPVGDIWVFEPDGLVFHKPATIVLPYNVTSAVGRDLEVFWSVGDTGKYEAVEGAQIANGLASFEVTHFSSGFVGFVVPVAEEPRLPEGMTFNAEENVAVNPVFVPTLKSNTMLDAAALNFKLKRGAVEVAGFGRLSANGKSYYFFPEHMLEPGAVYSASFTIGETDWAPTFTVMSDVGVSALTGNAQMVEGGQMLSFVPVVESVLEPAEYAASLMTIYDDFFVDTYLISPVFVDEKSAGVYTVITALADSMDFDGDGNYEPNHTTNGIRVKAELMGGYFLMNGPLTFSRVPGGDVSQTVTATIDHAFVSGTVHSTGTGMSSISAGMIMMYTSDCSALSEYFENGQVKTAVGVLCDPVDDDLFAVAGYSALPNDIDEVLFHLSDSGAWGVEVEMEPSLEAKYKNLRESQVQFEIFKDGELAAASTDYPGSVTVPGGWDTHGTLWESFDSVRFELPVGSELTPGDYTFRVIVGLYGFESAFTIE